MSSDTWKMHPAECLPLTAKQKTEVRQQLVQILESEYFSGSKRCCSFLKYSVEYILAERPLDELKERIIGVGVFHKQADYDTAQDNIVRVTANEVRKRLAQYYGDAPCAPDPIFHLSSGTYVVSFHWAQNNSGPQAAGPQTLEPIAPPSELPPVSGKHRSGTGWQVILVYGLGLIVLASIIGFGYWGAKDVVQDVWSPFIRSPKAAAISIAQPLAYRRASNSDQDTPLGPNEQMVAMPGAFVGIGDAFALADVVKVLSTHGKACQLLPGNAIPYQLVLTSPIIFIGNHSNKWIQEMMENQRFFFGSKDNGIYDRSTSKVKWALTDQGPGSKTGEDYAIVSRFANPINSQPVIIIAGLTTYGTQIAGDFITNPELLKEALRKAPKNWKNMNFQFVLHTKIMGDTPERPTVVASEFW